MYKNNEWGLRPYEGLVRWSRLKNKFWSCLCVKFPAKTSDGSKLPALLVQGDPMPFSALHGTHEDKSTQKDTCTHNFQIIKISIKRDYDCFLLYFVEEQLVLITHFFI